MLVQQVGMASEAFALAWLKKMVPEAQWRQGTKWEDEVLKADVVGEKDGMTCLVQVKSSYKAAMKFLFDNRNFKGRIIVVPVDGNAYLVDQEA